MSKLRKPIYKKSDQKIQKEQKIKVKMPHVNKELLSRKINLVRTKKLGLEWSMNGLGKPFRKKIRSKKIEKNSKHQSEIAACEQKTTRESELLF